MSFQQGHFSSSQIQFVRFFLTEFLLDRIKLSVNIIAMEHKYQTILSNNCKKWAKNPK